MSFVVFQVLSSSHAPTLSEVPCTQRKRPSTVASTTGSRKSNPRDIWTNEVKLWKEFRVGSNSCPLIIDDATMGRATRDDLWVVKLTVLLGVEVAQISSSRPDNRMFRSIRQTHNRAVVRKVKMNLPAESSMNVWKLNKHPTKLMQQARCEKDAQIVVACPPKR